MRATNGVNRRKSTRPISFFLVLFAFLVAGFVLSPTKALPAPQTSASEHSSIPPGTILPVILRSTISPDKAKQGEIIHGEIAQNVPLPGGSKIRKGSKVEGHVVEVVPAASGAGAKISVRFDKLYFQGQAIPITTDLRAIAGFMEVLDAGVPNEGMGEGDVGNWMTTTQIGGDSVFGVGGTVASAHDTSKAVGESLTDGGVLVQPNPNPSGRCRGALDGNDNPQALWVFSSDACGTYGLSKVSISHAGRTDPVGTVTLDLQAPKAKIQSGAGLLLRVVS